MAAVVDLVVAVVGLVDLVVVVAAVGVAAVAIVAAATSRLLTSSNWNCSGVGVNSWLAETGLANIFREQ